MGGRTGPFLVGCGVQLTPHGSQGNTFSVGCIIIDTASGCGVIIRPVVTPTFPQWSPIQGLGKPNAT